MLTDKTQLHLEEQFLTRSGENLLFASRTHAFVLIAPLSATLFLTVLAIGFLIFLHTYVAFPSVLLAGFICFVLLFAGTIMMKCIVDWYFHFYVITNFKVLEICYKPFFSKEINLVPLDQMRCVEITSSTQGIIKTVYDFGDVIIQLDFLTHQDTFILSDIASPQKTSMRLSDLFNVIIAGRLGDNRITTFPLAQTRQDNRFRIPTARRLANIIQMKGGEEYDSFV